MIKLFLGAERPKHFGKQKSLERRRSYLRGFPTVNCNGVRTKKTTIDIFLKPWVSRTQDKQSARPPNG